MSNNRTGKCFFYGKIIFIAVFNLHYYLSCKKSVRLTAFKDFV